MGHRDDFRLLEDARKIPARQLRKCLCLFRLAGRQPFLVCVRCIASHLTRERLAQNVTTLKILAVAGLLEHEIFGEVLVVVAYKEGLATLALEPRHFGALSGLALIREAQHKWFEALEALDKVSKIHPKMPQLEERLEQLSQQLGQTI